MQFANHHFSLSIPFIYRSGGPPTEANHHNSKLVELRDKT